MSTSCKYCNESEDKQYRPGLVCETCMCFVHLNCLRRPGTPGDLAGDVFFDFTCTECSPEHKEIFKRNKFPWVNVILLTLHHLSTQSYGISNHGYFHYKTHICSFIDRNWGILFDPHFKQKKNWVGTIAGALSVHGGGLLFRAGGPGAGWWRLARPYSPALAAHLLQELARDRPKGRIKSHLALDKNIFKEKVIELGYENLLDSGSEYDSASIEPAPKKLKRSHSALLLSDAGSFSYDDYELDNSVVCGRLATLDGSLEALGLCDSEQLTLPAACPSPLREASVPSFRTLSYDSDSRSLSPQTAPPADRQPAAENKSSKKEKPMVREESLFSRHNNSAERTPWLSPPPPLSSRLVDISEYEEIHLLKQVASWERRARGGEQREGLARLRAKLALRRLKRHKRLPLFNFDNCVRLLGGCYMGAGSSGAAQERVLDRFHRAYLVEQLSGQAGAVGARLLAAGGAALRSPHSGAALRPYIRRDRTARPPHIVLMEELLRRTHRDEVGWRPPTSLGVDYVYLGAGSVAAVNALLASCFWPGIELAECLARPEWAVVALSGRLVVGVGALVAGAAPMEAYLAFLAVRPGWRRAGLARFMLYHLLQTCSDMDVTLHVSPTNPAIFLYQKFGFKVEEFIQDFYEKYYDIDYKGCRHALFLRLVR